MSFKVLICSCNSLVQIGLKYCVKKSFANTTICSVKSLEQLYSKEFNFDLYIFDLSQFTEMYRIYELFVPKITEKKIVFLVENIEVENLLNFKKVSYIHNNLTNREIIKRLRLYCINNQSSINYKFDIKSQKKNINFSKRELQCAKLLMIGYSVTQISKILSLKVNTISTYKKKIMDKTNSNDMIQMIKILYTLKY